jgi:hypothetical protein
MITKITEYVTEENLGVDATGADVEKYMSVAKQALEKEFGCEVVVLNRAGAVEVEVDGEGYEAYEAEERALEDVRDFIGKNWTDWI